VNGSSRAIVTSGLSTKRERQETRNDSVLYGGGPAGALPDGNFPVLIALTAGYLNQPAPAVDRWLTMLERHKDRVEDPAVWEALTSRLANVLAAEPARAERFLDELFEAYPNVRDSRGGVVLIARSMHHLSPAKVEEWIDSLRAGTWQRGRQASAELHVLLATRSNAPRSSIEWIERELSVVPLDAQTALGLAHSAAHVWALPDRREAAARIISRLFPEGTISVTEALMGAFREGLIADAATELVLGSTLGSQNLVTSGSYALVESMADLLPAHGATIADVADHIVAEIRGAERPNSVSIGRDLTDIAMTLQRLASPLRERGLTLFESLLEIDVYGAKDALADLDHSNEPRPSGRRPRRAPGP